MSHDLNRRRFLQTTTAAIGTGLLSKIALQSSAAAPIAANERYKIGVCDWMILKRQKLGAFKWTKDIGADGVEVDMGSLGKRDTFENQLADPAVRQQFLDTARDTGLDQASSQFAGICRAPIGNRRERSGSERRPVRSPERAGARIPAGRRHARG